MATKNSFSACFKYNITDILTSRTFNIYYAKSVLKYVNGFSDKFYEQLSIIPLHDARKHQTRNYLLDIGNYLILEISAYM